MWVVQTAIDRSCKSLCSNSLLLIYLSSTFFKSHIPPPHPLAIKRLFFPQFVIRPARSCCLLLRSSYKCSSASSPWWFVCQVLRQHEKHKSQAFVENKRELAPRRPFEKERKKNPFQPAASSALTTLGEVNDDCWLSQNRPSGCFTKYSKARMVVMTKQQRLVFEV